MCRPVDNRICTVLALVLQLGSGQIYELKQTAVPENRSLHMLYAYFVYSSKEAPGRHLGEPFVEFTNLRIEPATTQGVQLSIMKYSHFWDLVDPKHFCATQEDVSGGIADHVDRFFVKKPVGQKNQDVDMYVTMLPPKGKRLQKNISASGVYLLVITNCGNSNGAVVSGTITVKNAYGFLPGIDFFKKPFYGWMCGIYVVLAIIWLLLSLRWWTELFSIQKCIGVVILFGIAESAMWYSFFKDWNETGHRGSKMLVISVGCTVVKSCFSYMLVLVASLGWGITRPFLDRGVLLKVQGLSFLYISLDFVRETILPLQRTHSVSLLFTVLCLVPVSLLNGIIFYWVFSALSSLMETLREHRQTDKLVLFRRLWHILVGSVSVAAVATLFQFFDLARDNTSRWRYQWIFADGVSHLIFLVVLLAMMYLWAPHQESKRYAFSQQLDDGADGSEQRADVWADEDLFDGDEDVDSFWESTHKELEKDDDQDRGFRADVIGSQSVQLPERKSYDSSRSAAHDREDVPIEDLL